MSDPAERASQARASVAVICPFFGSAEEGERVAERLATILRGDEDELLLVDNTRFGALSELDSERLGVRVVAAPHEQSSYHARNVGAEATSAEWLLFIDADCVPAPAILNSYFEEPIPAQCGAVAGAISGLASQEGMLARYARERGVLDQKRLVEREHGFAATANLLVRRSAWAVVGGFHEGIRSGGDVDFCWRLQEAGWTLVYREGARVEHVHRQTLRGLVRQYARYGAGRAWLERRHPTAPRASKHTALLIAAPALVAAHLLVGRREPAAYRALDAAIVAGNRAGRLLDNRPPSTVASLASGADVAFVTHVFPEPAADRAVERLSRSGARVCVEADARPARTRVRRARRLGVAYAEDDGVLHRAFCVGWLVARHPLRTLRESFAAVRGGPSLRRSAPRVRRLKERQVRVVCCLPDEHRACYEAARLARLTGLPCEVVRDDSAPVLRADAGGPPAQV